MSLWPQYTIFALYVAFFTLSVAKSGEPKGNFNPFVDLFSTALGVFILWKGGFFTPLGWAP